MKNLNKIIKTIKNMKVIISILLSFMLFSCTSSLYEVETVQAVIIIEKSYDAPKVYLPEGICQFIVQHPEYGWQQDFQCECNKYKNGDTIWYYEYGRINYLIY